MGPANGEKMGFLEKPQRPSNSSTLDGESQLSRTNGEPPKNQARMRLLRNLLLTLFLLTLFTIGAFCAAPRDIPIRNAAFAVHAPSPEEVEQFRELLNTVEPGSLHKVLHEHLKDRYQHGVYNEDKTAMEIVHRSNAEVARGLVELAKRQNGANSNSTSVSVPPSTTSEDPTSTIPSSTVVIPPTVTSTEESQTPTPSSSQPPSETTAAPSTETDTIQSTTTDGNESTSKPQVSTKESTPTTSPPEESPSSITQQVVYKTTLENGAQSVVTSITVVPAAAETGSGSGSKTNSANASLQTNAGTKLSRASTAAALLGALGIVVVVAL